MKIIFEKDSPASKAVFSALANQTNGELLTKSLVFGIIVTIGLECSLLIFEFNNYSFAPQRVLFSCLFLTTGHLLYSFYERANARRKSK